MTDGVVRSFATAGETVTRKAMVVAVLVGAVILATSVLRRRREPAPRQRICRSRGLVGGHALGGPKR